MLELRGIAKDFEGFPAVRELDLQLQEGEFFTLLGPSGCGKTTLLRLIGGFELPSRGEIWSRGRRIDTLKPHQRAINTVFQRYALFPHMTVRQNIEFGLRSARLSEQEIRSRAREALALVQLQGFEDRAVPTLSGGQSQRVALARALVNRPQVLLLDEPLSALDRKLRDELQVELLAIQRKLGLTFLLVTHDQEEALTLSDRIGVMKDGALMQVGRPEDVYARPATRDVAEFLGTVNRVPTDWFPPDRLPANCSEFCVRPEKLRLNPTGHSTELAFKAEVAEVLYGGPATKLWIQARHATRDGTARWWLPTERSDWELGQALRVHLLPGEGIALDSEGRRIP